MGNLALVQVCIARRAFLHSAFGISSMLGVYIVVSVSRI